MSEETIVAPLPWGREVIEGILPHRDPFVWESHCGHRARRFH